MIFHELKVHYERQTGEDTPRKVKEIYLVDGAANFADAEHCVIKEIQPFIFAGASEVHSCKRSQFQEIFPNEGGAFWYKARVELITVEDNGKETRKAVTILVCASTIQHAMKNLTEHLSSLDCEIVSITRSPILDVLRATT